MTKRECIDIAEMQDVFELPRSHPRRRHLEECPRCASLFASLRSFSDTSDEPAGADFEDADRRLSEAVENRIVRATSARADRASVQESAPSAIARVFEYLQRSPLRPITAVAVLAIALLGIRMIVNAPHEPSRTRTLRGETAPGKQQPVLESPRLLTDGGTRLSWRPVERAQSYRVVFYRADMSEVARWETGPESNLLLNAAKVEALAEAREPLFWGVTALRGRDEIGRSPIRVFTVPGKS